MEINKQALEILAAIPKPIAVIGVAGQYRTGKSYLLNRVILNQSKGFAVGPTINPCTKGIWMWGRPVKGFTKEGKPVNLIVLDSEGLGAIDEDTSHDSRIFSLVMLLSSCFVYNSTGTIDESALENLSLIVDLTKNIQLKSKPAQEDVDYDDFAYYMPAFIWVVRDFALELVDRRHNPITSDEYFQEALVEQEGDSDQIEQKNRIRRILHNFFQDRHCFTLVRPVNEEEQLKHIEQLSLDKLRPEFVSQTNELRSVIIDSAKVKSLENHPLSGEMFADLIKSYVSAINTQKVPVIENCWNYVAKNECFKAKEAAIKAYEEEMSSAFAKCWPMSKKALKDLNREYFEAALKGFRQLNYGEIQKKFEEDLVFELKKMYQDYKYENETEFEVMFKKYMEGLFVERIQPGLKNKAYKSYLDLENDLKFLEKAIKESNIEGPGKQIWATDFMIKKQAEAFKSFASLAKDESEAALAEQRDARRNAEVEAENVRQAAEKERKRTEARLTELGNDYENAQKKSRMIEEMMQKLKSEKEKTETFYEQKIKEVTDELAKQMRDLSNEKDQLTEERNQTKKEIIEVRAHAQSEMALLQNQIKILEERKAALSAADKNREEELERIQFDFQLKINDLNAKADSALSEKARRIDHLNEELLDTEEKLLTTEKILANKEAELESLEKQGKKAMVEMKSKLDQATERIKSLEKQTAQKTAGIVPNEKHTEALARIAELEEGVKNRDVALRMAKQQLDKENALNRQVAENAQLKYEEMKKKFDDLNAEYEKIISLTETDANDRQEDLARQMVQMKEEHSRELQNIEAQVTILQMKLDEEARRFAEDKAALEQAKVEFEAASKAETMRLKLNLDKSEKTVKSITAELSALKAEHEDELSKAEERSKIAIQELEEALDAVKKTSKAEIKEVLRKKEEDLKAIQSSFEDEKETLEIKWTDEKEKLVARITTLNKQAEARVEDVRREFEEALEAKDLELQSQRESFTLTEQALRSENANKMQRINEQMDTIKRLGDDFENFKRFANERMSNMQVDFDKDHERIIQERDTLKKSLNELENKLWETQNELTAALSDIAKYKESSAAELKKIDAELLSAKAELEQWKARAENSNQMSVQQKAELEKQLVMTQQQLKFKTEQHDELSKKLTYEKSKGEEKLRAQRELMERERSAAEQKAAELLKSVESKLNEKRKTQRELETRLEMKSAEAEKAKQNYEEKISALQIELASKDAYLVEKTAKLKSKVKTWKESSEKVTATCDLKLKEAAEKTRELEDKVFDLQGTIDRDAQIYAENKAHFQGQIDKLKSEAENSQRRFDLIFTRFNKKKDQENQEGQNTQNQIIQSLTDNHRTQLNELTQKYTLEVKTLTEKNQKLERELRQLREGVVADTRAKLDNYDLLESSVLELKETERMLQKQIAMTRQEKDAKIKTLETKYAQDVEKLKGKINELERTVGERERSIEKSKFSNQTERTKMLSQIEVLKSSVKSLREQLKESEEARETLVEQIEKLKNQNRKDRVLNNAIGGNSKWGRGVSFATGRQGEATVDGGDSLIGDMRTRETRDISKAFPLDENSEQDISTNKIL